MNVVPAKWFNHPAEDNPFHELAWLLYDRKDELDPVFFDELIDRIDTIYENEFISPESLQYAGDKPRTLRNKKAKDKTSTTKPTKKLKGNSMSLTKNNNRGNKNGSTPKHRNH